MFPCNSVCSAYKYCQSNAYCRVVGFEEVYNTHEHGQHPECCPPAIDDAYVDFMRPKLHANKFTHRTVDKLVRPLGCIHELIDEGSNERSTKHSSRPQRKIAGTVRGEKKKVTQFKSTDNKKLEGKEFLSDTSQAEDNFNLTEEYGKVKENHEFKDNKEPKRESSMESRQCSANGMNNRNNPNGSESDFQCSDREVKSDHSVNEQTSKDGNTKCFCNWCKSPLVTDSENLNQKGTATNNTNTDKGGGNMNKRTIGGSEEGNTMRKKISWMDAHESKLHKNLRNECSTNHICRMEVINEEPEEDCDNNNINNNINAQYLDAMGEDNFPNTLNNFQKKHLQSMAEGRYAEIFIMMHDNIMKSVNKSMESMLSQYCNKTVDQVENIYKRIERNEYLMEKIYDELLNKIADQNNTFANQYQIILQTIADGCKSQKHTSHHNYRQNSPIQADNSNGNIAHIQKNNLNDCPSVHQSRRCTRHLGGGLTHTNTYYDHEYHRHGGREASVDVLRKSSNYASNTIPSRGRSNSAMKMSRMDMMSRPFDLSKLSFGTSMDENRSCYYRHSECDYKSDLLHDHHKSNYCDRRQDFEQLKNDQSNMFEERMERDHHQQQQQQQQQYCHQRRSKQLEPDIQRMFSEYANGVFAKTYHNKPQDNDEVTFHKLRDMTERSESINRKSSGADRTNGNNSNSNSFFKDKLGQSSSNTGKSNTHFVYPSQRKMSCNRPS